MKYFSLNFKIEKEDHKSYYRDFRKASIATALRGSIFMAILSVFILFTSISNNMIAVVVPVVMFFLITLIYPLIYGKKISASLFESKLSGRNNIYDFYADHIEVHSLPDERSKSYSVRHLKMNGIVGVRESSTNFYFFYMNEKVLIIPKRVLDEEKYQMLKNMIENYFSNVYMTI